MNKRKGFTIIEVLIVIAIIAILATVTFIYLAPTRKTARDARRKVEVSQIGRLLTLGCYVPNAGEGDYDLASIINELGVKYPQFGAYLNNIPRDPLSGTDSASFYRYAVINTTPSRKCAVYANLENEGEAVTNANVTYPGPGGGTGVVQATSTGWNGSTKYFEFTN
jgi:prepilin-type N-terminal cleavage/methylation domain-containing protein